ncbi:MAG: gliding motility-associated C-terminal domain-containing protein [bacterium]|nr:gliding motility-associated C-terminal domain-containing protein [bacterium]
MSVTLHPRCALSRTAINTVSLAYTSLSNQSFSSPSDTAIVEIENPKATILRPGPGDRVSGSAVIVEAASEDTDIISIKYQYREAQKWTEITSSMGTGSIFSVAWDTTHLSDGSYDLRAVATDDEGDTDPYPKSITVTVSHLNPDYSEDPLIREQENIIEREDGVKIWLPAGALDCDGNGIVRISRPDQIPLGENPAKIYIEIELSSCQSQLNGPAFISISYPDEDDNGIVDGTFILEENLKVNFWDGAEWIELPTSVDTENNIATGTTTHFSIFGLFGVQAPDLSDVVVYPNPFRPDKDGTVKFLNLTENVKIRIYNVAGELVSARKDITTGAAGWDGRNDHGRAVVSGIYIYLITDKNGGKKTGKVALIR